VAFERTLIKEAEAGFAVVDSAVSEDPADSRIEIAAEYMDVSIWMLLT
jgi:hypothetical protein